MFQWVQAITAGLALSANQFTPTRSTSKGLVGHGTLKWVETIRQAYDIPGISLGVIASPNRTGHHEWVTEAHGFGYMDEQGRPVGGDVRLLRSWQISADCMQTLFAIASNSKLFVATSIGLLIENGTQLPNGNAFGYDTKIKDIYEDWSLVDPYMTEHLDVLDLLCEEAAVIIQDHDADM
jgi:CubicO group peptidase (beta-lactamase class C family)